MYRQFRAFEKPISTYFLRLKPSCDVKGKKIFFVIFIFLNRMFSFSIGEIAGPIIVILNIKERKRERIFYELSIQSNIRSRWLFALSGQHSRLLPVVFLCPWTFCRSLPSNGAVDRAVDYIVPRFTDATLLSIPAFSSPPTLFPPLFSVLFDPWKSFPFTYGYNETTKKRRSVPGMNEHAARSRTNFVRLYETRVPYAIFFCRKKYL